MLQEREAELIAGAVRREVKDWGKRCIEVAAKAATAVMDTGRRACINAGTAYWPVVPWPAGATEPGQSHFGYHWSPCSRRDLVERLAAAIDGHGLPEVHAWAVIPDTNQLLDLTTGAWPGRCWEMLGVEWAGGLPPDVFLADELPPGVVYQADESAVLLATCVAVGAGFLTLESVRAMSNGERGIADVVYGILRDAAGLSQC